MQVYEIQGDICDILEKDSISTDSGDKTIAKNQNDEKPCVLKAFAPFVIAIWPTTERDGREASSAERAAKSSNR
jgi:hypothetical protein